MIELTGDERRKNILTLIKQNETPISGSAIAKQMGVSRQVIVQDIALLRANKHDIVSTNRGYIINTIKEDELFKKVFKVSHDDEQIRDELSCIINLSGKVLDVFVDHEVYGKISVDLNIFNNQDIDDFVLQMEDNQVTPLKNITKNYHYHTIQAPSTKLLELIEVELKEKGFLCD